MQIKTSIQNIENYKKYLNLLGYIELFLQNKKYLKLDLPMLSPALIPESYLEIFKTEFRYMDKKEDLYLTPSPELFIKRLLSEDIGDCYYLGKSFRNSEPNSPKHSPEFTMLEFYKVGENYMFVAQEILELLRFLSEKIYGKKNQLVYKRKNISLEKWEKITVADAFKKYANISEKELFDEELFAKAAAKKGYSVKNSNYEDLWSQIYAQEIEPHLGTNGYPTLIYDYPVCFAALSKPNEDLQTAQRFEFYIDGVELGNCYSELSDWKLQKKRLELEEQSRLDQNKINHKSDKGFVEAIKKGMPECSGIAVGVERLAMIFTGVSSLDDLRLISVE